MQNLQLVFPEIFLSLSIMFLLVLGVFKKNSSQLIQNISLIVLLIIAVITFNETISINEKKLFNNSVVIDYLSSFMKIITLLAAFLVLIISSNYLRTFKIFKIEYPILILCSVLGMMIMISSNDLIVFYMGLELQSLALYVLATFNRDQIKSSEAGLKYFVLRHYHQVFYYMVVHYYMDLQAQQILMLFQINLILINMLLLLA